MRLWSLIFLLGVLLHTSQINQIENRVNRVVLDQDLESPQQKIGKAPSRHLMVSSSGDQQNKIGASVYTKLVDDYHSLWQQQLTEGTSRGDITLKKLSEARLVATAVYQMFKVAGYKDGAWNLEYDSNISLSKSTSRQGKSGYSYKGGRKISSLSEQNPPLPPKSSSSPMIEQSYLVLDEISDRLSSLGLLNSNMEHLHQLNLEMIDSVLKEVTSHPDLYKIPVKGKINITDIDFEVLSQRILVESNLKFALIGGSASALIGSTIHNKIKGSLLSIVAHGVAALTFDTLFMALGIHYGIKRLYLLHSYYTYCRNQRNRWGEAYVGQRKLSDGFAVDQMAISDLLRDEMQKLWVFGHLTSLVIKKGRQGEIISSVRQDLSRHALIWLGSPRLFSLIKGVAKLAFNFVSGRTITAFISKTLFRGEMFAAFKSGMPLLHRMVKRIFYLGRISAVGYLLDAGISGVIMYSMMYIRLHAASQMFHGVYRSPAVNIYLASLERHHDLESFAKASSKLFLPLCWQLGSELDSDNRSYQQSCRKIARHFTSSKDETNHSLPTAIKVSANMEELAQQAYQYPNHYRVLWTTALKAVYHDQRYAGIDQQIDTTVNHILIGRSKPRWYFDHITLDPFNMTIRMNMERFAKLVSQGAQKQNVSQAVFFSRYWKAHFMRGGQQLRQLEEIYQDSIGNSFTTIWEGVIGIKNSLSFSLERSFTKVHHFTTDYHNQLEVEGI
ncbi:MAG: hypothetical protein HN353_13710 [Bdellovibrionales bacterium]|nr:hypothetical protein [Bdellovibrionales bacterium]MBT3524850.1 hypothetical protein [Bdellovibrionales bacterium]